MIIAPDFQPTRSLVADTAGRIHGVLDEYEIYGPQMGADELDELSGAELAASVTSLAQAISRIEALKLRLVAQAEQQRVAVRSGMKSTGAWLARTTHAGQAAAARQVKLAGALTAEPGGSPKLAATSRALGDGQLSVDHAGVIASAMDKLPAGLTPEQRGVVEDRLVQTAKTVDPDRLRRTARRALAAVETDQKAVDAHENQLVVDEEAAARAKTRLTLHDNSDGTTTGHFTIPTLAAAVLKKVIDQLASPRRAKLGASTAQGAGRTVDPALWDRRRGDAFVTLLEHLPTDRLHGKVAATIVITTQLETLEGQLKAAGLDTGDQISAGQTRRLACGAGLLPAVLGSDSLPLDLGRASRFFTETQRVAGATRHTTCAADGCDTPYAWCELHHAQPWSRGGSTDLDQMVPLCSFHHHRIHDPAYAHALAPDGAVTFHRRS